jgi:hypothetical protein
MDQRFVSRITYLSVVYGRVLINRMRDVVRYLEIVCSALHV